MQPVPSALQQGVVRRRLAKPPETSQPLRWPPLDGVRRARLAIIEGEPGSHSSAKTRDGYSPITPLTCVNASIPVLDYSAWVR